ncbi:MAG: DUF1788 domain-containing protein [candidate division NC10 bacterium]|nr:DUF1788 domain-containing protein [candidate division NC10 bacterium]
MRTLEVDLLADPMRISAYHDLPFAIFQYDPPEEFACRREIVLLATRLHNRGKIVIPISLARLLWRTIEETEGLDAIAREEREFGFERAQRTVTTLLSDPDFKPLPDQLATLLASLDPDRAIVFLVRAGAMAPAIYRMAKLLEEMHGRTRVPMILFYPGHREGETDLSFMGMAGRGQMGTYNYRVKIY